MNNVFKRFAAEDNGAAMVEYSILIGIIAAATILVIIGVGTWVTGSFTGLCTGLIATATNAACAPAAAG
jgi:pilus assembly protein Flp/PilA